MLELELPGVAAESEGLDVLDARGGVLHWLLTPFPPGGGKPTYGTGHSELLTFVPAADARLRVRLAPAHAVAGRTTLVTVTVTERYGGRVHRVEGARVSVGAAHALTGPDGGPACACAGRGRAPCASPRPSNACSPGARSLTFVRGQRPSTRRRGGVERVTQRGEATRGRGCG